MRKMFHTYGLIPSYIENSSIASLLIDLPGLGWPPGPHVKALQLQYVAGGEGAAEPGAFQGGSGGGEAQRLPQFLLLGDGERKGAVKTSPAPRVSTVCTGKAGVS